MKKTYQIGQMVRFMIQSGGYGFGKIVERAIKNPHLYKIETATGVYWVMAAEIVTKPK